MCLNHDQMDFGNGSSQWDKIDTKDGSGLVQLVQGEKSV